MILRRPPRSPSPDPCESPFAFPLLPARAPSLCIVNTCLAYLAFFSITCEMQIFQLLVLMVFHLMRGWGASSAPGTSRRSDLQNVQTGSRPIHCVFIFLRTLLHFFALLKNSTLLFSCASALFAKNTRGPTPHAVPSPIPVGELLGVGAVMLTSHQSPLWGPAAALERLFSAFNDPFPFSFRSEAAKALPFSPFCTPSMAPSTIILINSSKPTWGSQPNFSRALVASPQRDSTSAGRISLGSIWTYSSQSRPATPQAASRI